jgi:hypothetical protein
MQTLFIYFVLEYTMRNQVIDFCPFYMNRWDLQRIREQKIYDKLKEKERSAENLKKGENQHVDSFYHTLEDSKTFVNCNAQ